MELIRNPIEEYSLRHCLETYTLAFCIPYLKAVHLIAEHPSIHHPRSSIFGMVNDSIAYGRDD